MCSWSGISVNSLCTPACSAGVSPTKNISGTISTPEGLEVSKQNIGLLYKRVFVNCAEVSHPLWDPVDSLAPPKEVDGDAQIVCDVSASPWFSLGGSLLN